MYRVDGSLRPRRGDPRALGGLPRFEPGPDRQRRRRPAAARHLRRGDRQHLPRATSTGSRSGTGAGWRSRGMLDWLARQLGPARGGHLGDPRRPQGLHLRPADELGRARPRASGWPPSTAGRRRWTAGRPRATPIYDQIMERGWNAERQAFVQHYDDRRAGLLAAADVARRLHRRRPTRCGPRPSTRWTTSSSPTASSTATTRRPRRTGCAARRARSRCAPSPTSTRWPGPAGWTRPGSPSRRCSPTPTTSGCSPRRSP